MQNVLIEDKSLCMIEELLGNYGQAKNHCNLSIDAIQAGDDKKPSAEMANVLHILGIIERRLGNHHSSIEFLDKALKITEEIHGKVEHISMANTLNNLGLAQVYIGEYGMARKTLQRAFVIKKKHYGEHHISTIHTLNNIGILDMYAGDFNKAKKIFETTIRAKKTHYQKENHISLEHPLRHLAISEEGLGMYQDALLHLQQSYEISSKYYLDRLHEQMQHSYSPSFIWINISSNNTEQSIQYFKDALVIIKSYFGEAHHLVARYYYLLGQAYTVNKQIEEAGEQYLKATHILANLPKNIEIKNKLKHVQLHFKKIGTIMAHKKHS